MGEKLKTEDAKKYQIVSRILGILMRIGNVCCWIGAVAVACTAIACSVIVPNIKIDRDAKEISAFDKSYSYDFREKEIEIGEGDEKIVIKDNEIKLGENGSVFSVKFSDDSIKEIEKFIENDAMRILAALPYVLVLATASIVFTALALGHGASVLKNIATKKTPFIDENVTRLEKLAKYLIISYVITFACNFAMTLIADGKSVNLSASGSISVILGVYVAIYVLKSGIANETKKEKIEKKD